MGFATIGVIRGEEQPFNESLALAVEDGMRLHYIDRATYRRKSDSTVLAMLRAELGEHYLIPEGGSAPAALLGCAELIAEIPEPFDLVVCPVGTGGTLAGLSMGLSPGQRVLGYAVLRGVEYLDDEIVRLQRETSGRILSNWTVDHRFHCGGFARRSAALDEFITDFERRHGFLLDRVYVAKAMLGLFTCIAQNELGTVGTVVFVVTGPKELDVAGRPQRARARRARVSSR